ncbi:unnamed protein product [Trichobilharzia regenti]|nr:unnamed protein product [Trichobilharzia regenti]
MCKEESKISDDSKYGNQSKFTMFTSNSAQTVADIFASISDADTSPQLFGNILVAPTSSVTRLGEASLTYLNQGVLMDLTLTDSSDLEIGLLSCNSSLVDLEYGDDIVVPLR